MEQQISALRFQLSSQQMDGELAIQVFFVILREFHIAHREPNFFEGFQTHFCVYIALSHPIKCNSRKPEACFGAKRVKSPAGTVGTRELQWEPSRNSGSPTVTLGVQQLQYEPSTDSGPPAVTVGPLQVQSEPRSYSGNPGVTVGAQP